MSIYLRNLSIGLYQGKMGLCIYFFYLSKLLQKHEYHVFAEKILADIYSSVNHISVVDFDKGISGIAWGIHHLIENGFVTGNPDYILHEADDLIYRTIHFDWFSDKTKYRIDFLRLLFYYSDRLRTVKNATEKEIVQRTVIQIINHIENNFVNSSWSTPRCFNLEMNELAVYLCLLSRIYRLEFYNYKIIRIWKNLSDIVLSSMPMLHANGLFLLLGMLKVLECIELPGWKQHVLFLDEHIDHEKIINDEFLNKNVTLRRGISGYCLLLFLSANFPFHLKKHIMEKIEMSDVWMGRFNPLSLAFNGNIGLLDGCTGVSLIYQLLDNYGHENRSI